MLKQKNLLIATILVATALLTGCSKSDGFSTSKTSGTAGTSETNGTKATNETSDRTLDQEVIVINRHTLPPEPDPAVNNATLLGVDSNDNGVRDDVERWIYETYKDKHPIYIDIAMQAGRAYKLVLEHPERAKEIREVIIAPSHCAWYYQNDAKYFNEPLLVNEKITSPVQGKYFNTKERNDVYWEYDTLLSGGIYSLPKIKDEKSFCDFDTSKYDKK